ncbi:MAG: LuxR C-terminal-related transcriptional regulator [Janthinobacterium lividum]
MLHPTAALLGADAPPPLAYPLRLAIVEDDPTVRALLHDYLCDCPEFRCTSTVGSVEDLWRELALALPPQLLLLDLSLPGQSGLDALPRLLESLPELRVLVQTMHDSADTVFQALRAGAAGYVVKSATPLPAYRQALLEVARGGIAISPAIAGKVLAYFTPSVTQQPDLLSEREREVLVGLVDGLSEKQVAARLDITYSTVHIHVRRIYKKLQVNSRAELMSRYAKGQM